MDSVSLSSALARIVSEEHVLTGAAIADDYTHDEALTSQPVRPDVVVRPDATGPAQYLGVQPQFGVVAVGAGPQFAPGTGGAPQSRHGGRVVWALLVIGVHHR